MAKNSGTFIIDDSVPESAREKIKDRVNGWLDNMKTELGERQPILLKRQDFYEGRHHRWTNVIGQGNKRQEGHIQAVFNYIYRFCQKLHQALTNSEPKFKIKATDESDEIEASRAYAVQELIYKVLEDNKFFPMIFKRASINQIRDGDFSIECRVVTDDKNGKHIEISTTEDMGKLMVGWDDASGLDFSFVAFRDLWTLSKIKRDFNYDAEAFTEKPDSGETQKGSHFKDQYGMFSTTTGASPVMVPTGQSQLPKAEVIDYWGYEVINKEVKVVNLIFLNRDMVQFVITDYKRIPRFIGHSFIAAGKPWSMSFIDPLVDPQIELNDRTGEEGDMVRIGSHTKFLVVNMPDFDADSIKPGSGQVIYVEGEGADFKPLTVNNAIFPSETYINRVLEHMYAIGLPRIALATGSLPYTGKIGAIAYQPIIDYVLDLRAQWEIVFQDLVEVIQEYFIDYFPEYRQIFTEHTVDPETGMGEDGDIIIRKVEFDWENVLPLSKSDKVVDASTLRDRGAISLDTFLGEVGFKNPLEEIKKLKKEAADPEMQTLRTQFAQFSPGVVSASLDAQKKSAEQQEQTAEMIGAAQQAQQQGQQTPTGTPAPIQHQDQNEKRGVMTAMGTPTGQVSSAAGALRQATQNLNAKAGV